MCLHLRIVRLLFRRLARSCISLSLGFLIIPCSLHAKDLGPLIYGDALFSYYQGDQFTTINKLLTAKKRDELASTQQEADLMLGSLYLNYGLPHEADAVFTDLIEADILPTTKAKTWFKKAALLYSQGNNKQAEKILQSELKELPVAMQHDKKIMLANLLLEDGQFDVAVQQFQEIPLNSKQGAYARFNAAIACSRNNNIELAAKLFQEVMQLPPDNAEMASLRDRAALTLGYLYLQKGLATEAKQSLQQVRLQGPFSNPALLGLGWADYRLGTKEKAAVAWRELALRNPTDSSVQEAVVALANVYEELQAMQKALEAYRQAVITYKKEIHRIDLTIQDIQTDQWADKLVTIRKNADRELPMAEIPGFVPRVNTDTDYLYKLFATDSFNRVYKNFIELRRLKYVVKHWQQQIPVFLNVLDTQVQNKENRQISQQERIELMEDRQQKLLSGYQILVADIKQAASSHNAYQLASSEQQEWWQKLDDIHRRLDLVRDAPQWEALTNRYQRLKGIVMWQTTHEFPQHESDQFDQLKLIRGHLDRSNLHIAALQQAQRDLDQRFDNDFYQHFTETQSRLDQMELEVDKHTEIYKVHMEKLALDVLNNNKRQLQQLLAQAHFSVTRLEDLAATKNRGHL